MPTNFDFSCVYDLRADSYSCSSFKVALKEFEETIRLEIYGWSSPDP